MNFSDLCEIENQINRIEQAQAVLHEITSYFAKFDEAKYLPCYAEQIGLLLYATENLLYNVVPSLKDAVKSLAEQGQTPAEKAVKNEGD